MVEIYLKNTLLVCIAAGLVLRMLYYNAGGYIIAVLYGDCLQEMLAVVSCKTQGSDIKFQWHLTAHFYIKIGL